MYPVAACAVSAVVLAIVISKVSIHGDMGLPHTIDLGMQEEPGVIGCRF